MITFDLLKCWMEKLFVGCFEEKCTDKTDYHTHLHPVIETHIEKHWDSSYGKFCEIQVKMRQQLWGSESRQSLAEVYIYCPLQKGHWALYPRERSHAERPLAPIWQRAPRINNFNSVKESMEWKWSTGWCISNLWKGNKNLFCFLTMMIIIIIV